MKFSDMKQAATLLGTEWNLGRRESGAAGSICSWIYLMDILKETERMVVYKEDRKLIGLCGYSNIHSHRRLLRKSFYALIEKVLFHSRKIKDKKALREYYSNYSYCPEKLSKEFDGEISILIVAPEYRGMGVGKKLLSEVFELATNDGIKKLQILTDESCGYHFYDTLGCKVVYETIVENMEHNKLGTSHSEKAYVYEKELSA